MGKYRIIPRETWGAKPPKSDAVEIATEQDRLWQHHSVTSPVVGNAAPQLMQQIAFQRGFSDISYTHVVDVEGNIFEGRGIGRLGAHTLGDNENSWAIVAVGNFEANKPPLKMLLAIAWLTRKYYVRNWDAGFGLDGGHRDAYARGFCATNTACPGKYLHALIPQINKYAKTRAWADRKSTRKPDPATLPVLRLDDEGRRVEMLQELLNRFGYTIPVSGQFRKVTDRAVRKFQLRYKLKVDGVVGQLTWEQLITRGWK